MLGIARQTMSKWIQLDVFKPGECFIRRSPGKLAPLWWSVDQCRQALKDYSAKRLETYEV